MGNASSAQHNRLSKPKTNTNSPFASPKVGVPSPSSTSSKYKDVYANDPSAAVVRGPSGDYRSRQDVRQQLRADLTSVDGDFAFSSDEDDDLGELATHVQARLSNLSRSNSVISHIASAQTSTTRLTSLPGSKLSLAPDPISVDVNSALKILQELRKNASPEDLAALHQALLPSKSTELARTVSRGPTSSTDTLRATPLIRRRSLATPGVATRISPNDASRRPWKPLDISQHCSQEEEWKVEMMGTSPLTRIAALDQAESGRDSPAPRAQTPGDMAYSHLGSLKLGSLVVTNGAASPAPSVMTRHTDRQNSALDLSSQEEDYFTASEGMGTPVIGKKGHVRSQSSVLPLPAYVKRPSWKPRRERNMKSTTRSGSPLKKETRSRELVDDLSDNQSRATSLDIERQTAPSIAQEYLAEIESSPFAQEFGADVLMRGEIPRREYGNSHFRESVVFREEAFRMLEGTIFGGDYPPHAPEHTCNKNERPPPLKADSGYSSGASLRGLQDGSQPMEEGIDPSLPQQTSVLADSQTSRNGHNLEDTGSLYTFEQMLSLPAEEKPLPTIPPHKSVRQRPSRLSWRRSSSSMAPTVSTPPTPLSVSCRSVESSNASIQKRLQKRQPSYCSLPIVQSAHPVVEGTIPSIPDDIRAHFTRRLSEQPGMDHLTRTFASVSDTASTAEANSECSSPSELILQGRPRRHNRAQSERPPTPPPHRHRRLSGFRKSSEAEKRKSVDIEDSIGLVDLGTVAQSLGGSPYDIAIPHVLPVPLTSPTYPHQLGNALPRAKSMVNMDAATASEFARVRRRERSLSRESSRPRSYHDYNLEAGEAVALRRSRPHSTCTDVPPVPSIEPHRLSLVRSSSYRIDRNVEPPSQAAGSARPKLYTRDTSVSQIVAKFEESSTQQGQSDWESHSRHWRQRRQSAGEGLRRSEAETASICSSTANQRNDSIFDRYSGGLDYGYEHGYGVGGSAGTRHLRSGASRKSMHFSNQFGVDLSDIPVFLQKAN